MDRRGFLAAGAGLAGVAAAGTYLSLRSRRSPGSGPGEYPPVRWGFVGTGSIARFMGSVVASTPLASLAAVSSRRMDTATDFAGEFGAERAFDSWSTMAEWEGVDAIYVATPTSVREEICLAAAQHGKHVLAEKPFASLPSVQRITMACEENNVAFMDGTHFVHSSRHRSMKSELSSVVGTPRKMVSYVQTSNRNRDNIRYQPDLEPMGALGDVGWYIMRAAAECLPDDATLIQSDCRLQRDEETSAVVEAHGSHDFSDGSALVWTCGYRLVGASADLRIFGPRGSILVDRFMADSGEYQTRRLDGTPRPSTRTVKVDSGRPYTRRMFEDFAAIVAESAGREYWVRSSLRTQLLLDAAFDSAAQNGLVGT